VRVPKPPAEVAFVGKLDGTRPWADLKRTVGVKYVPAPVLDQGDNGGAGEEAAGRRRTRRNRGRKERGQEKMNTDSEKVKSDAT